MIGPRRVEGFVIVSSDGMIANANGVMPESIHNDADQNVFQDALDRVAVVVHGRHSYEGGPRAAQRKRLVVTRQIAAIAPDPAHPNSLLWNPDGATIEQAIAALGAPAGVIAPPQSQPADLTEILRASVAALKSERGKPGGPATSDDSAAPDGPAKSRTRAKAGATGKDDTAAKEETAKSATRRKASA